MAATALDIPYLAATYSVPQQDLESLQLAPTSSLVESLLAHLTTFAKSHETLQAQKVQADLQVEHAVRSSEARVLQFKRNSEKSLKDAEELRKKLTESGMLPCASFVYIN